MFEEITVYDENLIRLQNSHPTRSECLKMLEDYKTPDHVKRHCIGVTAVAVAVAKELNKNGLNLDIAAIEGAGLIHDIARVEDKHWEIGCRIAGELGYYHEANIIMNHMFHDFSIDGKITELDLVCLGDRVVKEHRYVGLPARMEYIKNKARSSGNSANLSRIEKKARDAFAFAEKIEKIIGMSLRQLMKREGIIKNTKEKLDGMLKKVEKPARYTGGELNSVMKDPQKAELHMGFAFPDTYEIGMSYMGMQILYNLLNKEENVYCERIFVPNTDMEKLLREEEVELFTIETKTPLSELDMIGFTLNYEMSYTNVLNMLDLANIPLRSADREFDCPLIVAGGPCAYNPEPLADIIDLFEVGDGEEMMIELAKEYIKAKRDGITKREFLKRASKIHGVYIPSFYEPLYNPDGTISEIRKLYDEAPDRVERALIEDLNKAEFPTNPIVPFVETVHDRSVVETFRGCTRGCRFCQAGMIYRPVRERTSDEIIRICKEQLANTGHDELSLLSLSTSDYSQFEPLVGVLMPYCKNHNVSLSLPSLRLDNFSFKVLQEIQEYRKSGLTFAPEAGSQRLRDVINKNITEKDIFDAVEQAIELGWTHIKLYFMIGHPYETYEDLDGIADIASRIIAINKRLRAGGGAGRFSVTVSVSNFVPKPFTPFQWAPQDTAESFVQKHNYLSSKLNPIKGVIFNYHDTETSGLEAVFARGDRRLGELLISAFNNGCKFDSWSEHFNAQGWAKAFEETGIDPLFYSCRERSYDEILPWSIIDGYISEEFLKSENEKAKKAITTPDCRHACVGCGMNKHTTCTMGGYYGKIRD